MYNFPHTLSLLYIVVKKQVGLLVYAQERFKVRNQFSRSI